MHLNTEMVDENGFQFTQSAFHRMTTNNFIVATDENNDDEANYFFSEDNYQREAPPLLSGQRMSQRV